MSSADLIIATLSVAGVNRVYGVVGDSLNGITDAMQRDGSIEWVHLQHEEAAAFAACGEAQVSGSLAVCAGRVAQAMFRPRAVTKPATGSSTEAVMNAFAVHAK